MKAIVLGGSGNVGSRLVSNLLINNNICSSITIISRRPLPQYQNINKINVKIIENLNQIEQEDFQSHNVAFMLLGIGRPSQVTKEELMNIDCIIPVLFAKACYNSGIRHISLLSAIGSDVTSEYSWITKTGAGGGYYNHVKGLMEREVTNLGFTSVAIFQPAAIYPGNENTPSMFGAFNQSLNFLLPGSINTVSSDEIGIAMIKTMQYQLEGKITGTQFIVGGRDIRLRSEEI